MTILLPDLPYAYDALEPYIDAETMTLHHDKHHATYVANVNAALEKHPEIGEDLEALLADVTQIPEDIRQAVINNGGGHLNHALFWELMSPEKTEITTEVAAAIDEAFGSFDAPVIKTCENILENSYSELGSSCNKPCSYKFI